MCMREENGKNTEEGKKKKERKELDVNERRPIRLRRATEWM